MSLRIKLVLALLLAAGCAAPCGTKDAPTPCGIACGLENKCPEGYRCVEKVCTPTTEGAQPTGPVACADVRASGRP